jgi:hypothetical protein
MMAATITDRAKRYQAQNNVDPREDRCFACGAPNPLDVHHIDGREDNGEPENLTRACRSCNVQIANVMRTAGLGKKTVQFNKKPKQGAPSLGGYLTAVQILKGEQAGNVAAAVREIRATSATQRSAYARRIWAIRRKRYGASGRNPGLLDAVGATPGDYLMGKVAGQLQNRKRRRNPADEAEDAYQRFHGRPPNGVVVVETAVHHHTRLAGAGELLGLVIRFEDEGNEYDVVLKGFKGALLAMNEKRTQLYVEGGDQSINLAEFAIDKPYHEYETLGRLVAVGYYTTKDHLDAKDGGEAEYWHMIEWTEEFPAHLKKQVTQAEKNELDDNEGPDVIYDVRSKLLSFSGGTYTIPDEGIDR